MARNLRLSALVTNAPFPVPIQATPKAGTPVLAVLAVRCSVCAACRRVAKPASCSLELTLRWYLGRNTSSVLHHTLKHTPATPTLRWYLGRKTSRAWRRRPYTVAASTCGCSGNEEEGNGRKDAHTHRQMQAKAPGRAAVAAGTGSSKTAVWLDHTPGRAAAGAGTGLSSPFERAWRCGAVRSSQRPVVHRRHETAEAC